MKLTSYLSACLSKRTYYKAENTYVFEQANLTHSSFSLPRLLYPALNPADRIVTGSTCTFGKSHTTPYTSLLCGSWCVINSRIGKERNRERVLLGSGKKKLCDTTETHPPLELWRQSRRIWIFTENRALLGFFVVLYFPKTSQISYERTFSVKRLH